MNDLPSTSHTLHVWYLFPQKINVGMPDASALRDLFSVFIVFAQPGGKVSRRTGIVLRFPETHTNIQTEGGKWHAIRKQPQPDPFIPQLNYRIQFIYVATGGLYK
jgi:hypothetical protein